MFVATVTAPSLRPGHDGALRAQQRVRPRAQHFTIQTIIISEPSHKSHQTLDRRRTHQHGPALLVLARDFRGRGAILRVDSLIHSIVVVLARDGNAVGMGTTMVNRRRSTPWRRLLPCPSSPRVEKARSGRDWNVTAPRVSFDWSREPFFRFHGLLEPVAYLRPSSTLALKASTSLTCRASSMRQSHSFSSNSLARKAESKKGAQGSLASKSGLPRAPSASGVAIFI